MSGEEISPEEILSRFVAGPDQLEAALSGLSESDLDLALAPGEWSIRQIVHHLADSDDTWAMCIKMALGAPGSIFDLYWYLGNKPWADALDYTDRGIEPAVALFRTQRLYIAQLLERIPAGWRYDVILKAPWALDGRPMRMDALINLLIEHAAEHVEEIQKVRAKHGL
jgi:uncharacterized damage-inducible protein DinB